MGNTTTITEAAKVKRKRWTQWRPPIAKDLIDPIGKAAEDAGIKPCAWLILAIRAYLAPDPQKCEVCSGDTQTTHRCTDCQATFRIRRGEQPSDDCPVAEPKVSRVPAVNFPLHGGKNPVYHEGEGPFIEVRCQGCGGILSVATHCDQCHPVTP